MISLRTRLGQAVIFSASAVLLLFLVLPLFVLLARAIEVDLLQQIQQPTVTQALRLSLITSTVSTVITVALGTPLAYSLARRKVPARSIIETLLDLPIVLPPAVAGLALLLTFGRRGLFGPVLETLGLNLPFTTVAVIMAETFVAAPFFIRSAQTGFGSVSHQLEESASDLGANSWQVFRRITLPLAGTALLSGAILSWARALGEFGATILFAGSFIGRTQTMPLAIYHALESDLGAAVALAAILILISFCFLTLLRLITHGRIGHPML
ncbi:MAG TPA: ABC transporter permease [Anaerolineae bacterium]|nr:ABC transporter permease [Anaerolineae bacterium]